MIIRFIEEKDVATCNEFHNRAYGTSRTIEQWRWEFVPTIYRDDKIPFAVVDDGGKIVGTQAFIPIQMIDLEGVFWTAKSEETLVDPAYRGQELSAKMYRFLFEYAEDKNLAYIWGFTYATKALDRVGFVKPSVTTQLIFPFSSALKSRLDDRTNTTRMIGPIGNLKAFIYKMGIGVGQLLSAAKFFINDPARKISPAAKALTLRTLNAPPNEAGRVCKRFIQRRGGKTIYRDADFLRWRIFENPYLKGIFRGIYDQDDLVGWVIYAVCDDGVGYIIDMMVAPEEGKSYTLDDIARILLRDAVIGTKKMGAAALRSWHVNDHPLDRMLAAEAKRMGFFHIRKGMSVVIYASAAATTRATFDRYHDWFITRIYNEGVSG